MATSGSLTTAEFEGRSLTIYWSRTAVIDNTSRVSWSVVGTGTLPSGYYVTCGNMYLEINGVVVLNNSTRINVFTGATVYSGTIDIPHNPNGTKSFWLSFSAGIYYFATNAYASGTQTLDVIPRYPAYINNSPYAEAITTSSANIAICPDVTCDLAQISLDGGSFYTIRSGDFSSWITPTLNNFSSGTAHSFITRIRRKDSQLTTDSATKTFTTTQHSVTSFSASDITDTSFKVNYSANDLVNYAQYSLNGGAWTDLPNTALIGGTLASDTDYNVKIRLRATVSGLWSESSTITVRTLAQNNFMPVLEGTK